MPRSEDPTARGRILDAAGRLYYDRGVNAVGIAEIVAAAGTGRNVLYRHFSGRQELLLAYLQDFADGMDRAMATATDGLPPDEALVAMAARVAEMVSRPGYRGCPFRNYLRETRDLEDAAGRLALSRVQGLRHRIADLTAGLDLPDPGHTAELIWLVLEGVYAAAPYPDRVAIADAGVRHVQELVRS